jgi:hypothetical protein
MVFLILTRSYFAPFLLEPLESQSLSFTATVPTLGMAALLSRLASFTAWTALSLSTAESPYLKSKKEDL